MVTKSGGEWPFKMCLAVSDFFLQPLSQSRLISFVTLGKSRVHRKKNISLLQSLKFTIHHPCKKVISVLCQLIPCIFLCFQLLQALQARSQKRSAYTLHMDEISPSLASLKGSAVYMPGQTHFSGKVILFPALVHYVEIIAVHLPLHVSFTCLK